jgi:hypothetical protein
MVEVVVERSLPGSGSAVGNGGCRFSFSSKDGEPRKHHNRCKSDPTPQGRGRCVYYSSGNRLPRASVNVHCAQFTNACCGSELRARAPPSPPFPLCKLTAGLTYGNPIQKRVVEALQFGGRLIARTAVSSGSDNGFCV